MNLEIKDYAEMLKEENEPTRHVAKYAVSRFVQYSGILDAINKSRPKTVKEFTREEVEKFLVVRYLRYRDKQYDTFLAGGKEDDASKEARLIDDFKDAPNLKIELNDCEAFYCRNSNKFYRLIDTGRYDTDGYFKSRVFNLKPFDSKISIVISELDFVKFYIKVIPYRIYTEAVGATSEEGKRYSEFLKEVSKTFYIRMINGTYTGIDQFAGSCPFYDLTIRKRNRDVCTHLLLNRLTLQ